MNPNAGVLGVFSYGIDETRFRMCTYVSEGEKVIAPYKGTTGIVCTVLVAAGYHARVVNERRGFDKWFNIQDLAKKVLL